MSNQKHTVSTDALDTLGTCPIPENSGRDAIHLAVEPAIAGETLYPAQRCRIIDGVAFGTGSIGGETTGIVDPFVNNTIYKGDKFWFVVLPRTITSLRHVWSHPAFPEAQSVADDDSHYIAKVERLKSYIIDTSESVSKADMTRFLDEVDTFVPEQSMGMARMKEWCNEIGERYDYIMAGAKKYLESGDYTYGEKDSGNLEGVDLPSWFWDTYETITGEKASGHRRDDGGFFTCSC